jgi:membrane protein/epoxyqueuosine reductase
LNDQQSPNPQTRAAATAAAFEAAENPRLSHWYRWRQDGKSLLSYLLESEVHTFGFSVAANAILSFIPFIVLLYTLAQSVFHSPGMVKTISDMVIYFFPSNQTFVADKLYLVATHSARHGVQALSLIMILVACTGIFLPLEVALNQAWGISKSRNYIMNQIVAFGLAILMVILGFAAIMVTTISTAMFGDVLQGHSGWLGDICNWLFSMLHHLVLAISTGIASILFFFSIYWLLPNRKVPWRPVLKTSIYTGLIWLVSKYLFVEFLLPHLDLSELYGPFSVSVGLIFWAYTTGLILFAGAQFSVSRIGAAKKPE